MAVSKWIAMIGAVAAISVSSVYAASHSTDTNWSGGATVAGCVLIALASLLRRKRRS